MMALRTPLTPVGARGRPVPPGIRRNGLQTEGRRRRVAASSPMQEALVLGGGSGGGGAAAGQQQQRQRAPTDRSSEAAAPPFAPLTAIWARNAAAHGSRVALEDPHHPGPPAVTYAELAALITDFGAGLRSLGLEPGERVCLFSEDSSRWLVADQGIMACGAADAVRGSSAPDAELSYILGHCRPSGLIVQDAPTLARLLPALAAPGAPALKFIAVLWPSKVAGSGGSDGDGGGEALRAAAGAVSCPVLGYDEVLAAGQGLRAAAPFAPHPSGRDDVATIVYTSGTTGHPKGVMLSQGNLRSQIDNFDFFLQVSPGDSSLSLLPPWHIYQRTTALYLASKAARIVYSSKFKFRDDLTSHPPDHFVCVPLVLETLYNKIMAKLKSEKGVKAAVANALISASLAYVAANRVTQGVALTFARAPRPLAVAVWAGLLAALLRPLHQLADALVFTKVRAALGIRRTVVSGGGSLPPHLDDFFEAAGLTVLVGYGLTETAPVLTCRRAQPGANIRGSVGLPIPGTQLRIVNPETMQEVPDGTQGLVLARGPGVMRGYFDDPAATAAAFADGGWFITGDLGWRAPAGVEGSATAGHLVLTGRAKDTIVLVSGKNVEPAPIEDAITTSPYIKHAILVGQDKRELGALLITDEEALLADGVIAGPYDPSAAAASPGGGDEAARLAALLSSEAARAISASRPDARAEEHVARFRVVRAPLSPEDGTLTRTMKPRRAAVLEREAAVVKELMRQLRG